MAADHPSTPVSGEVTPELCAIGTYLGRCTLPAGHDGRHSPFAAPLSPADPTREEAPSASPGEAGEDALAEALRAIRHGHTTQSGDTLSSAECAALDAEFARLSSQSQEIARLRRRVEIMDRALTRYVPCAGHRDKLVAGECQVCRRERAESQLARLREALGLAAALIADFTQHSDPRFARLSGQLAEVLNG